VIARGVRGPGSSPFTSNPLLVFFIVLLVLNFRTLGSLLDEAVTQPLTFWSFIAAIVLGVTFHEFMHAYAAHRLGDDTARLMGRLTLNPLAHFDLFGSLFLLLLRFGYGKPVPVTESRLRGGRVAGALVALAGPFTNLALATVCALPLRFSAAGVGEFENAYRFVLTAIVVYNCLLFVFNLIPIPPLDGSRVVYGLLPPQQAYTWRSYEYAGPFILLAVIFLVPSFLHIDLLTPFVRAPASFLISILLGRQV
jgi:Zn-dependent protease